MTPLAALGVASVVGILLVGLAAWLLNVPGWAVLVGMAGGLWAVWRFVRRRSGSVAREKAES